MHVSHQRGPAGGRSAARISESNTMSGKRCAARACIPGYEWARLQRREGWTSDGYTRCGGDGSLGVRDLMRI